MITNKARLILILESEKLAEEFIERLLAHVTIENVTKFLEIWRENTRGD